jgi:hypothetical protein
MRDLRAALCAFALVANCLLPTLAVAQPRLERESDPPRPVRLFAAVELGALDPLYHRIQLSQTGTEFDYVESGGQDVLFPFTRLSLQLELARHRVVLLYQPLELDTRVALVEALTVDGLTFAPETPVDLQYGFPFYRASYLYAVLSGQSGELALGAGLQIRDATITFTSADGLQRRSNRDVGPVPLLEASFRQELGGRWFWGGEVAGFYAPVKYLNGGDSDVVGAIVDASVRAGVQLSGTVLGFFNVRWLGGGAEGTSEPDAFGDGYNANWLHFLTVSAGVQFEVR